jgi:hypothetical protein
MHCRSVTLVVLPSGAPVLGRAAEHEAPFVLTVEETSDGLRVTDGRTGAVTSVAPAGITLPNGELLTAARITRFHVGLEDVTDLTDAFRTLAHRMAFSAPVDAESALGDGAAPSVMAAVGSRDERVTLFRKIPNPREALYLRERVKKALALTSAPAGQDGE